MYQDEPARYPQEVVHMALEIGAQTTLTRVTYADANCA